MLPIETDIFDNINDRIIEYYQYIPENYIWHGIKGPFIAPAVSPNIFNSIATSCIINDMKNALDILGVEP